MCPTLCMKLALKIKGQKASPKDSLFQAGQKQAEKSNMVRACGTVGMIKIRTSLLPVVLSQTTSPRENCDDLKPPSDLRWRRQWQPTPVLLPGKSHGRRSLVGYSPWGR